MSVRGLKFLDNWLAEQLPILARGDPVAASDLADQLMTAAEKAGIGAEEISNEVESVFEGDASGPQQPNGLTGSWLVHIPVFPSVRGFRRGSRFTRGGRNRTNVLGWGDSQKVSQWLGQNRQSSFLRLKSSASWWQQKRCT
ncbi:DUF768 domain-containing protein [Mesorhizobium sp. M7A.F.Ca.MR.362.00.0.0]|uniref:DUF768 domain-containing protein n=1 Tax=Mesorhizobium sp. M7A.F.Ca.MR.362.00.0.0 TaxID=2496779 RepID=UPI000FD5818E|nr:DUF768 domain-containing protein [Mesorhizobium sp. M7A.F.Ca.MR.362.00.0.0]RUU82817.1 DUF768 domain-containing protein [Mesorhizobium sp. M7A.F.Ca.MR.362.00.0.0]RWN96451.1 MAG: DUF768 domain-containing protein [Mesorhizobium sp.]